MGKHYFLNNVCTKQNQNGYLEILEIIDPFDKLDNLFVGK